MYTFIDYFLMPMYTNMKRVWCVRLQCILYNVNSTCIVFFFYFSEIQYIFTPLTPTEWNVVFVWLKSGNTRLPPLHVLHKYMISPGALYILPRPGGGRGGLHTRHPSYIINIQTTPRIIIYACVCVCMFVSFWCFFFFVCVRWRSRLSVDFFSV